MFRHLDALQETGLTSGETTLGPLRTEPGEYRSVTMPMICRNSRAFVLCTVILAAGIVPPTAPSAAALTPEETACQVQTLTATVEYVKAVFETRQDCFSSIAAMVPPPPDIDCLASTDDGTGDEGIDARLRRARVVFGQKIVRDCLGVVMENLGFPGFCEDPDGMPYTAFEHETCLTEAADEIIANMLDIEHPTAPGTPEASEIACEDLVARKSSRMFASELDARAACLKKTFQESIPPDSVDCRAELDQLAPGTGDARTDTNVVAAHNKVIRRIANHCAGVDLGTLGFPHRCTNVAAGTVYPLAALTQCMFDTHHGDLMRLLDRMSPTTSKCGNGDIDFTEQCDDGDTIEGQGDLCRRDCVVNSHCGDTDASGVPTIRDVLYILRVSIGLASCALEICDVNNDGHITATDALTLLQWVVGSSVELICPAPLSITCGNGIIDAFEQCDDGNSGWQFGDVCNASCQRLACGDPNDSGTFTASDAQFIMRAALDLETCDLAVCDVNGDGIVTTTDVLNVLRVATGQEIEFNCPF